MTGPQVLVERRVAATPERVWQVLTDLRAAARTLSGVSRVEVLTPEPFGAGTRWRETRTAARRAGVSGRGGRASDAGLPGGSGRSGGAGGSGGAGRVSTEELRVTACEPPYRYVAESASRGARRVREFSVAPDLDDTAVLRVTVAVTASGGAARIAAKAFGRLGTKAVAAAIQRDLADIAAVAERG